MNRRLVFTAVVLGALLLAALPAQAQPLVRGFLKYHGLTTLTMDSVTFGYAGQVPRTEATLGWLSHVDMLDSFDFPGVAWPDSILRIFSTFGTTSNRPDSIMSPVSGEWHADHFNAHDSFEIMFEQLGSGLEESGRNRTEAALGQALPNPFQSATTIRYSVPVAGGVQLTVYNLVGRPVRTLVAGLTPAGSHSAVWDGADDAGRALESGIYFCRLTAPGRTLTEKLILDR